ncbi:hypothetical protein E1176_14825 [Fulvivirga sp. RKSG066]|uniref:hypothetical protein n=1 Tax=Fulvivirga aurantia TaxID=2529383 RepID=UPI00162A0179|nr:hypothetical protein [Fulvivirga aurantia]MTI22303.1 hypothetical protein [Fulvivirga aurantia]
MMSLLGVLKFIELITAVIGSVYYKKYAHTFLKYFLWLLWLVVGVEFSMWFLKHYEIRSQNNFIYNVLTSVMYLYYLTLYYKEIKTKRYRKWVLAFIITFSAAITINFIFIQKLMTTSLFHSYTFALGGILLIAAIGLFLLETLNSEKVLYYKKYLLFWVSIGLVLYYASIIPYAISLNFLPEFRFSETWIAIIFTINLVMYTCFSIGFVVSKKMEI